MKIERVKTQKTYVRDWVYSKTGVIIVSILALLLLKATWNVFKANMIAERNYEKAEREFLALQAREEQVEAELNRLKTAQGTEEEIRKKFNVAKEGEEVVVVVEDESKEVESKEERGFFGSLWHTITSVF